MGSRATPSARPRPCAPSRPSRRAAYPAPHRLGSRRMHSAALYLAPILAEKSRTPFFIAGGVLAAWALIVSLGFGLRLPSFPDNLGGERAVIAISAVLVLA